MASKQESSSVASSAELHPRYALCFQLCGITIFIIGLAIGLLIGIFAIDINKGQTPIAAVQLTTIPTIKTTVKTNTDNYQCPKKLRPTKSKTSADKGVFELLSVSEMEEVRDFMKQRGVITVGEGLPTLKDSYIYGMSLLLPNKSRALKYLDQGQDSPGRYADVHVHRGNRNPPDIMEYKVGPLGGAMSISNLYVDGELHYNSRPRDGIEWDGLTDQITRAMAVLRPLLQESFDGGFFPGGGLTFHPQAPPGLNPHERETRFVMTLLVDGTARGRDLHPLPLTGTVHNPGNDISQWNTHSFYYLNQGPYATAQDLLDAYNSNSLKKFAFSSGYRNTIFAETFPKQNSDARRKYSENKSPPRSYNPSGPRFDIHDHNVKWMGWDFTIGASQFRGPSIFDVKFKGQRIVYENSLNEVTLVYASDVSSGANTIYMDATFGIGEFQDIIPKVDCPDHAEVLEATWYNSYNQKPTSAKTVCVFETVGDQSLWRRKDKFAAGLANNCLVVRVPMSVGNYDYTIEFHFYAEGTMKTEAFASGYLQSSFWDPDSPNAGANKVTDPFGYRVAEHTHGAIHDHTFGFKVDLDIIGTENNFEIIDWKAGDVLNALNTQTSLAKKPNYYLYNQTRYVEWQTLQKETGLKIDMSHPQFWSVVNADKKNKWGVNRGYRIVPETMVSQALPDTHPVMKAASYTKYHCSVTKRKENEQYASGTYDLNRLADPLVSMDVMLNNETVVGEDLITWLSIGFLHVPRAEDVPMTIRAHSSFLLTPFNYFDSAASFDMPQYVDTSDHSITERPTAFTPCLEEQLEACYFCD